MRLDVVMTALHVSALLVWVGAVISGFLAAGVKGDDATRQDIARRLFRWVANPALLLALLFGTVRLGLDWRYYFVTTHFMHAKLPLAFVAIAAHHFLSARVRKAPTATRFRGTPTTLAALVFGLSCFAAVLLVIVRPF